MFKLAPPTLSATLYARPKPIDRTPARCFDLPIKSQSEGIMRIIQNSILAAAFAGLTLVALTAHAATSEPSSSDSSGSRLVKVVPADAKNAGPNVTVRVEDNQTPKSSQQVYLNPAENRPEDAVIICRKTETLGSRLRAKRVCRSVAQWRASSNQAREDVTRVHNSERGGQCLPGAMGC
jgi:hypothetical protein